MRALPDGTMAAIASGEASIDDLDLEALFPVPAVEEARQSEPEAEGPPMTGTRKRLLDEARWASEQPWPGRSGTTDRLVYATILDIAFIANTTDGLHLSLRRLRQPTGIAVETARRSRLRLVERKLLTPIEKGKPEWLASSFNLTLQHERRNETHTELLPSPIGSYVSRYATLPDAFRTKRGLPKAAWVLLNRLGDTPQKRADLARELKRHPSTISRNLRQLESAGLALQTTQGWIYVDADLERLAHDLGTAGAAERMRREDAIQREAYHAYLERVGRREQEPKTEEPNARAESRAA
jgi:hypothetical protein